MKPEDRKLSTKDIAAAMESREHDPAEAGRVERERLETAREQRPVTDAATDAPGPLFGEEELAGYRARWSGIQTGFVDEPRRAVEEADTLVAELMKRLVDTFSDERRQLESQWEKSDTVSTEDLRLAMRRYRSFFERLLSV